MDSPAPAHTVTGWSGTAAHAARPSTSVRRLVAAGVGGAALVATAALGAAACIANGGPSRSAPTSARLITVTTEPAEPGHPGRTAESP